MSDVGEDVLTLDALRKAKEQIDELNKCKKCNTVPEIMVIGYFGVHCECEALRLSKTERAQESMRKLKKYFEEDLI